MYHLLLIDPFYAADPSAAAFEMEELILPSLMSKYCPNQQTFLCSEVLSLEAGAGWCHLVCHLLFFN